MTSTNLLCIVFAINSGNLIGQRVLLQVWKHILRNRRRGCLIYISLEATFPTGFDTVIRLIDSEYFHKVTEQLRWETTSGNHKVFGGLKLYI